MNNSMRSSIVKTANITRRSALMAGAGLTVASCALLDPILSPFQTDDQDIASAPAYDEPILIRDLNIGVILPDETSLNGDVARSMTNAMHIALSEYGDDAPTVGYVSGANDPAGASIGALNLIDSGAQIILGPISSRSTSRAGVATRKAGVTMLSFSSDENVARDGIYLMSFLPRSEVSSIVEYAAVQNINSIAIMAPLTPYADVAEINFKQYVSDYSLKSAGIERYGRDQRDIDLAARNISELVRSRLVDGIFIPASGDDLFAALLALRTYDITPKNTPIMGTGIWDSQSVFQNELTSGAMYATPDKDLFNNFASRYRQRYNAEPRRQATLAFDAIQLAVALATNGFGPDNFTDPAGFYGTDGLFRFQPSGLSERKLTVYRIESDNAIAIAKPAPAFTA